MEDKPIKPGAPSPVEPPKPEPVKEVVGFSSEELSLIGVEREGNTKLLIFGVGNDFIVIIPQWAYFEYLDNIYEETFFIQAEDGGNCIHNWTEPRVEEVYDKDASVKEFSVEDENPVEVSKKSIPVYKVFNLVENTIIGIHSNEENIKND